MKTLLCVLTALTMLVYQNACGQSVATGIPVASDGTGIGACATGDAYVVLERGPNHRLVGHITSEVLASGKTVIYTNTYVELAGGMHYMDASSGQWVESQELIESYPGGAVARHGPNQVVFANDLASPGAVDMLTPDGKRLTSHILGLAYVDSVSGASVLICETTNSLGSIVPPNQVVYPNAFDTINAYVQYTYRKSGLEQDIVLLEAPPLPEAYGLSSTTARLVVMTEFVNPPDPTVQASIFTDGTGQVSDQTLGFGSLRIGPGKGFLLGNGGGGQGLKISKEWSLLEGRHFLIEQISVTDLIKAITTLPKNQGSSVKPPSEAIRFGATTKGRLPALKPARAEAKPMELASHKPAGEGYILDYFTMVSSNNFTFQSDMTYYVSGNISLGGTVRCEGGSVIKLAPTNNAQITISGSLVTLGTQYRPTIFTARDDMTVGESIPGGFANPYTNFYGTMLSLSSATTLNDCRFSYASNAISTTANLTLTNVQFVACGTPIYGAANSLTFTVRNGLFWSNSIVFGQGQSQIFKGEHLTVNQPGTFFTASGSPSCSVYLTNCLLVGLSGWGNNVTVASTNQVPWPASASGVLQTVGAGGAYLVDNSPYRNAGSTNINPGLAAGLAQSTTYPPVVLTNRITVDTVLSPQAQRDKDTPDIGYHYAPLDYVVNNVTLTNTLTLTNGVAVGSYGSSSSFGVSVSGSGSFVSQGSARALNYIVRYNTVQEQSSTNWSASSVAPSIKLASTKPSYCWFTGWSMAGGIGDHVNSSSSGTTNSGFIHCQFKGGKFTMYPGLAAVTNCLFERVYTTFDDFSDSDVWYVYNNLFKGGTFYYRIHGSTPVAVAYDNLFDQTAITKGSGSDYFTNGWNGYVTNFSTLGLNNQGGDVILTNKPVYQTSWLGSYYYPTNDGMLSKLIDAGSRWATNAGLYHFTTTTNQVKEGSSKVDIGFHFVAVNPTTGLPYDADGDGIPDYVEDANGNGVADAGETDWQSYNSGNGLIGAAGLQVFTPLK